MDLGCFLILIIKNVISIGKHEKKALDYIGFIGCLREFDGRFQ